MAQPIYESLSQDKIFSIAQSANSFSKNVKTSKTCEYLLSYDECIEDYNGKDFRQAIIAVLLMNGATNLKSYVASTIHFTSKIHSDEHTTKNWYSYLLSIFPKNFYFVLARVYKNDGTYFIQKKANLDLEKEFQKQVNYVLSIPQVVKLI